MSRTVTVLGLVFAFILLGTRHAQAVDGTWTNLAGGAWSTAANWNPNTVADGTGAVADFSTLDLTANAVVNNDAARTVGTLLFGDTSPSHNWTLTNAALTLAVSSGTPTITVDNQTATVGVKLQGTQGLIKNGAGTLRLDAGTRADAINTYTGGTYVLAGTLQHGAAGQNWVHNLGTGTVYLGDTNGSASVVLKQIYGAVVTPNNIVLQSGSSGTITIQSDGGNEYFDGAITLGSPNSSGRSLIIAVNGGGMQFRSTIQDPVGLTGTAGQVTIAGGNVAISGNNTYSGGTVINSSTLQLGHVSALGKGGLTVNSGVVDLNANSVTVGALSGSGGSITDTGAAVGTTTLTVTQSVDTTYSGVISNGANRVIAFTKTGTGKLTLAGWNTYSGATKVNAGGLVVVTGGSSVNGSVTVADGATNGVQVAVSSGQWTCSNLTYSAGTTTLDINFGSGVPSANTAPLRVVGDLDMGTVGISVRNGLWPATPGIYPLVSYSGTLSGTVPGIALVLPSGLTATIVNNTGSKRIDLNVTAVTWSPSSYNTWTNLVSGNASGLWGGGANWSNGIPNGVDAVADFSTLNITVNSSVNNDAPRTVAKLLFADTAASHDWWLTNAALTLASTVIQPVIDVSNRTVTIGAALLGTQGFRKTGTGQLNIDQNLTTGATGLNTYSGGTYIAAGTLMFGTGNNNYIQGMIGPGTVYLGDSSGSANVVLQSQYGAYQLYNNIIVQSGNTGIMQINNNGGALYLYGTITLGSSGGNGKSLTFGRVSSGQIQIDGSIQDPINMTPGTAGTVKITNQGPGLVFNGANTYTGATVIEGDSKLVANASNANNGGIPPLSALTVNGTLDMNDRSFTIGSLSGTGIVDRIINSGSASTLTVGSNNTSTVFSGVIKNSQASYPVSLVKIGSGALTLSGVNTYCGMTTISNGTLVVSNNLALSTNTVVLAGGGVGAAAGTWAITNVVNAQAASTLGASGTLALMGNVTNNGALTLVSGGLLINGSKTGTGALTVSGGYLGGTGTVAGTVTNLATITAGDTNSIGTLTVTNLVMAENSAMVWNYYSASSQDTITVTGNLTLPAVATVNVVRVSGTLPAQGVLFNYGSIVTNAATLNGWVITGARPDARAKVFNNQVLLVSPTGMILEIQ